jgi:hypothetical protein
VKIADLTSTGFQINAALDSGQYGHITVQDVQNHIESRDIFEYLKQQIEFEAGLLTDEAKSKIIDQWLDMSLALNARRKFGVTKSGLALLIAYILEGLQRL